ncbi:MAG: hypothetical protein EAZ91_22095 [Cytophagales bacterium]|nr:MAG: hypothetical protein EAZ91_22095 [Cytophagales bacterium]
MQIIRKHAVVKDGILQIPMPTSLNNRQVEVNVVIGVDEWGDADDEFPVPRAKAGELPELPPRKKANLGHLVGSWGHLTTEQRKDMDEQLRSIRDSWERDTF